ncbi:MAG: hypothetical protein ACJAWV_003107 [Flammeovirgaceae bacterium]|jgi:hypothetical protein
MARLFKDFYTPELLPFKQKFYSALGEKERRHFLAQEYLFLGKGSQRYLARVFECSRKTIQKGVKELSTPDFFPDYSYNREPGAGRKKGRGISGFDGNRSWLCLPAYRRQPY